MGPFFVVVIFPLAVIVSIVVILASLGKSLGIQKLLIDLLLAIFEWGSKHEKAVIEPGSSDENLPSNLPDTSKRPRSQSETSNIIIHDKTETIEQKLRDIVNPERKTSTVKLVVDDSFDFITAGMESIIEDQVTSRFKAEQLPSWNLLTRTSFGFQHINKKLTILWITGFFIRYFILLPIRSALFVIGFLVLVVIAHLSARISDIRAKKWLNKRAMAICMRILSRTFSAVIRFHNHENRAKHGGICVANHTSPIDVMILSCDNNYAMVGQRQKGILGFLQSTVSLTGDHIWFERSEASDRAKVIQKLKEHVDDSKMPIIIFPEGTCINNTSVMMFKKGAFEVGEVVYPIAMKYDPRFGDAFWNSSEQSYGEYLFRMMTSWAIICDVWYLPPMHRLEGENAINFALRVKKAIAKKGGLVELDWDGGLKRSKVSPKLIQQHQKRYWDWLSRKSSLCSRSPLQPDENSEREEARKLYDHQEAEEDNNCFMDAHMEKHRKSSRETGQVFDVMPEDYQSFKAEPISTDISKSNTGHHEAELIHRTKGNQNTE